MAMFLSRLKRKTTSEIERLIIQKVYIEYMIREELPRQLENFSLMQKLQCQSTCEFYYHVMTEKGYPEETKKSALDRVERNFLALEKGLAETSSSEEEEELDLGIPSNVIQKVRAEIKKSGNSGNREVER